MIMPWSEQRSDFSIRSEYKEAFTEQNIYGTGSSISIRHDKLIVILHSFLYKISLQLSEDFLRKIVLFVSA